MNQEKFLQYIFVALWLSAFTHTILCISAEHLCAQKIRPFTMPLWRVNRTTFFTADNPGSISVV